MEGCSVHLGLKVGEEENPHHQSVLFSQSFYRSHFPIHTHTQAPDILCPPQLTDNLTLTVG